MRRVSLPKGITQHEDGYFVVTYADGTYYNNGRPRMRIERCQGTVKDAKDLQTRRKAAVSEGRALPENEKKRVVLFAEIANDKLTDLKQYLVSPEKMQAWRSENARMKAMIGWWGQRDAKTLTTQEVRERLFEAKEAREWSTTTFNRYRMLLLTTYTLATTNGKVSGDNPVLKVKPFTEDNKRVRYLKPEEKERLWRTLLTDYAWYMPLVVIALNTGLRASSLYGMDWENVDWERRLITVSRQFVKGSKEAYAGINDATLAALYVLRARKTTQEMRGPVFVAKSQGFRKSGGARLRSHSHWFPQMIREAGIQDFRFHDLRHTFASLLLHGGSSLKQIQEALGHSDIKMTLRYAHLLEGERLATVKILDAMSEAAFPLSNFPTQSSHKLLGDGATTTKPN